MMDTILNLGLNDATEAGLAAASGDAAFARDCHDRFRAILPRRRGRRGARGPVAAAAGRDRGRVPVVEQRAGARLPRASRGSATTSAPASRSRRWCSATSARTRDRRPVHPQPRDRRGRAYGDVLFDAQGEDVVAGTHATEPVAVLGDRLPAVAAELRRHAETPRAPLPRLLRHRVHDRARPAVDAPGPGRQADAAGRAADGGRHGRGPGVPAHPRGGGPARARPSWRTRRRPSWTGAARVRRSPGAGRLAGARLGRDPVDLGRRRRGRGRGRRRDPRPPRDVTRRHRGDGPGASGSSPRPAGSRATPPSSRAAGASPPSSGRPRSSAGARRSDRGADARGGRRSSRSTARPATCSRASRRASRWSSPRRRCCSGWARELGIRSVSRRTRPRRRGAGETADRGPPRTMPSACCAIKGYATPRRHSRTRCGARRTSRRRLLDALIGRGPRRARRGRVPPHGDGPGRAAALARGRPRGMGRGRGTAALDAFLDLDQRMKAIVTAWQVREVDGAQVLNDHADDGLRRGGAGRRSRHSTRRRGLARRSSTAPCRGSPGTASASSRRPAQAAAGNGKFIASPRVDSYHGAWFELHEDLIRLAGRTREAEVAAGRA